MKQEDIDLTIREIKDAVYSTLIIQNKKSWHFCEQKIKKILERAP